MPHRRGRNFFPYTTLFRSSKEDPLLVAPWEMPEPLLPVAVVAKSRADEDALAKNLSRLVAGDPTMRLERNPETRQQVLRSEEHTSELQSRPHLVCRLLLEK